MIYVLLPMSLLVCLSFGMMAIECMKPLRSIEAELRHKKCLLNTERMEREIWPERFSSPSPQELADEFDIAPGTIWTMDDLAARGIINSSWGTEIGLRLQGR